MSKIFKPAQSEQEFLITLIASAYCKQYGYKFDITEYDISSIRPRVNYTHGYEVITKIETDNVRLRAYFNIDENSEVGKFSNYVEQGKASLGNLDDEVLVAFGTLDGWLRQEKVFNFRPLNNENLLGNYILLEDGKEAILLESGDKLALEKG